jgi:hypothetical protein
MWQLHHVRRVKFCLEEAFGGVGDNLPVPHKRERAARNCT